MCASTPNTAPENIVLHVAVAAIVNSQDQVLLSLRPDHVHQGGLWEFPGGKVEPNESVRQALEREIHEELGIHIGISRPLIRIHHRYPDREVLLDVWRIDAFGGEVAGREGQAVEWVPIRELGTRAFPAANRPIIHALQLPPAYLITPEPGPQQAVYLQQLRSALEAGIRLVQLRAPGLSSRDYAQLAQQVVPLCHRYQAQVLLNADAELVEQTGADGLHLNSQRLAQCSVRPLPESFTLIASCHNREQLQHARQIGVDAAVLSPVQPTASHPAAQPLGWARFADWVEHCPFPVYALGGMQAADIATAQAHGGQGVAAIRALWPGE
jgi:8-oxo-dGTP diphosphatase